MFAYETPESSSDATPEGGDWWSGALEGWSRDAFDELHALVTAAADDQRFRSQTLRRRLGLARGWPRRPTRPAGRPAIVAIPPDDAARYLENALGDLRTRHPSQSSKELLSRRARSILICVVMANLVLLLVAPVKTIIGWIAMATVAYVAVIVDRVLLFSRSVSGDAIDVVSDEEARAIPDDDLPTFTVLVPAYREPEVIAHLLTAVGGLEYPADKLDVKLLLEADDDETIAAATRVAMPIAVDVVLVPPAEPRTKPKALNYGLHLAIGDIVTVYDAEDVPDLLQLRRAAVVFARHGDEVACIQAQLSFANVRQNLITRWFTLEYGMWFETFLPGLVASGAPVPLGGTSNHFRRSVLETLGAWDPYNVTEDADLGVRMHRGGHRTRVLKSVTLEEANSDFVNWVKQRSRWYKGYLQTWIVHLRRPRQLVRDVGWKGFARFNLFVGGTPLLSALNPVFWTMTIVWFTDKPHVIKLLFPAPVFYLGLFCWAIGNFTIAYLWVVATRLTKRSELLLAALLVPLYWVIMAVAVAKALIQLVITPSYWEKTTHGLHLQRHRDTPVTMVTEVTS